MAKERFEVSTKGMKALQSGREPWQLAKELVSNSWDEEITRCDVTLESLGPRRAKIIVSDDGKGFTKIEDVWTLMGDTPKRGRPDVRGRFNIGEKEILSVAISASIHTKDKIVAFPKSGGRRVSNAEMIIGTVIVCILPWRPKQVSETVAKLKKLLVPENIEYTVNGYRVPYEAPKETTRARLETVLQKSPMEPITSTFRFTEIEIMLGYNSKGMLYEMGIPVQKIACPYLVNVMQKVPMPPNRDVVKDSYLKDIYAAVLNCMVDEIEVASDSWIRLAIESGYVTKDTIKQVMEKRYGEKAVLWSSDTWANEQAVDHGYEIIHARTLSGDERQEFEKVGLVHSSDIFQLTPVTADYIPLDEYTDGMKLMARYAKYLAKELLNKEIGIYIYKLPSEPFAAKWTGNSIGFNYSTLGKAFFEKVTPVVTGVILHELSHCEGNGHDPLYLKSLEKLAGKAVHLAATKFIDFMDYGIY